MRGHHFNMGTSSIYKKFKTTSVLALILIFFTFYFDKVSYGLPYFWNPDEIDFQNSLLSVLYLASDQLVLSYNPLYAPVINVILILNSVLINEVLINSLSFEQIKSKIYFNPELFLFYGRLASLTITSFSIFFLYLIFKKLKINFLIYFTLLITFSTSLLMFNISTIMGKNSCNVLIYLIQIYFFSKYLIKIEKFNNKSYLIFGLLAATAWGVNYWPAFISIYAVLYFHFTKFRFTKINYLTIFFIIFFIFGPFVNLFFVDKTPFWHLFNSNEEENIKIGIIFESILERIIVSIKTIYFADKNLLLLITTMPFFLLSKFTKYKKEFLTLVVLFIEPIVLFGFTGTLIPQLRYFGGIISVILILTAIIFNELYKTNFKYLILFFFALNFYLIGDNLNKIYKTNNVLKQKHSFINFNQDIGIDRSKILYLIDLNFQESLNQNNYYKKLFDNDLISKNSRSQKFFENISKKSKKLVNTDNIILENLALKENIIYHNYTFFQISDLKNFFDFIKKDFEYVLIEESKPPYLSDTILQKKIKIFVKDNFILERIQHNQNKIFLRNQQSIIHYFSNSLTELDIANSSNKYNKESDVIYGSNFGLYRLK